MPEPDKSALFAMNGESDSDDDTRTLSVEDAAFFGGNAGSFLEGLSLPYGSLAHAHAHAVHIFLPPFLLPSFIFWSSLNCVYMSSTDCGTFLLSHRRPTLPAISPLLLS